MAITTIEERPTLENDVDLANVIMPFVNTEAQIDPQDLGSQQRKLTAKQFLQLVLNTLQPELALLVDNEDTIAYNYSESPVAKVSLTISQALRGINITNVVGIQEVYLIVEHAVGGTAITLPGVTTGVSFNTEEGGTTLLRGLFTGTYWIWTSNISSGASLDSEKPILQNIRILSSNPTELLLTYNELLLTSGVPDVSCYFPSGKTVTYVQVAGSTIKVGIDSAYAAGSTPTLAFVSGAVKLRDMAGNIADNFTSQPILIGEFDPAIIQDLQNASDEGSGTIAFVDGFPSGGNFSGGTVQQKLKNQPGAKFRFKIPDDVNLASAVVIGLRAVESSNYSYSTQAFKLLTYPSGTAYYYFKAGGADSIINNLTCEPGDILEYSVPAFDDAAVKISKDGGLTWVTIDTVVGLLAGLADVFIVALNASNGVNKRMLNLQISNPA